MAQQEERIECWFLIPTERNPDPETSVREKHPTELWDVFHRNLRKQFAAWSGPVDVISARVKAVEDVQRTPGEWPNEAGEPVPDESRKYTLIIPEGGVEDLRSFLEKVANSFDQDVILLIVRGVDRSVHRRRAAGFLDGDLWSA